MAQKLTPPEIMEEMKALFLERSKIYGANYQMVGNVLKAFFPNGVRLRSDHDFLVWHLFELMIVKLTRFVHSGLSHHDSIRDLAVYATMVESELDGERIGDVENTSDRIG